MDEFMVSGREWVVAVLSPPGTLPMGARSRHWERPQLPQLPQLNVLFIVHVEPCQTSQAE